MSQVKRQAACFSKKDPTKMYWMGYFNSGMGYDDYGNWNPLSDKNWIANGKFDTSFYIVDVTTGEAERIDNIDDRYMFAYMWIDEDDDVPAGKRGDVNMDGAVDVDDITALTNYVLNGSTNGISIENAECNQIEGIDIEDVTSLINYVLNGQW